MKILPLQCILLTFSNFFPCGLISRMSNISSKRIVCVDICVVSFPPRSDVLDHFSNRCASVFCLFEAFFSSTLITLPRYETTQCKKERFVQKLATATSFSPLLFTYNSFSFPHYLSLAMLLAACSEE